MLTTVWYSTLYLGPYGFNGAVEIYHPRFLYELRSPFPPLQSEITKHPAHPHLPFLSELNYFLEKEILY